MGKKFLLGMISIVATLTLVACGWNDTNKGDTTATGTNVTNNNEKMDKQLGENMNGVSDEGHSTNGEVPENLKKVESPKFPVGSKVIIQANHFDGMEGAEGTIVGAYDTTAYSVTYSPTTEGNPVSNYKWIIKEDLDGLGEKTIKPKTEVIINSDFMEGMKGASGVIDTEEKTTVYMVDFTSKTGDQIINYKWLIESELKAK